MSLPSSDRILKGYLLGFTLCLVLTTVPFVLVMHGRASQNTLLAVIFSAAILQILVQMRFFLHLDASPEQRWTLMSLLYTLLIVGILVGGSLWIMHSTGAHMM